MRLLQRIAAALSILASVVQAQFSESFGGNIVLGRPTDRSITVNALFTSAQDSVYLEYGTAATSLTGSTPPQAAIKANVPYQEVISNLAPDTVYYYRVNSKGPGKSTFSQSATHSFHTQRPPGSTFTFTLVADSHLPVAQHCNPARYALTLQNAREDNPDFHIDLGDTFYSDNIGNNQTSLTYQQVVQRHIDHRPFFGILTHSAPLFLANGNHDGEYLYYSNPSAGINTNLPVWATNARVALFPNPVDDAFYAADTTVHPEIAGGVRQSYYSWTWGDALFVVLDPYWEFPDVNVSNWDPVHGDAQYAWLSRVLRNSKAKYKFVFEHHANGQSRGGIEAAPAYEFGGQPGRNMQTFQQARPNWSLPIHQLMAQTGVTAYFQGHDHLFAKGVLDGIPYVTAPMPGAGPPASNDFFPGNPTGGWFASYSNSVALPGSGHLRVTVSPNGVKVEFVTVKLPNVDIGANKEVAFSFTAAAAPPFLSIVSAASYQQVAVAPGSIATAFAAGLPTSGANVTVTDSSGSARPAQIISQTGAQLSFVVPPATAPGPAAVAIATVAAPIATGAIQIQTLAPAIFTANANGAGAPAAIAVLAKADGTQTVQSVFTCATGGACVPAPLKFGAATDQLVLSLYGTGIQNRNALADVSVFVGGVAAKLLYAGPQGQYPGLDQVNVVVPNSLAGSAEVSVILTVAGKHANVTTINLQ